MFCKNCGSQLPDGSGFCSMCGERVTIEIAHPVVMQEEQPKTSKGLIVGAIATSCVAVVAVVAAVVLFLNSSTFNPVDINSNTFPDERMRSIVSFTFDTDKDNVISKEEMASVTALTLDGVQDFTGLELLAPLENVTINNCPSIKIVVPENTKTQQLIIKESPRVEELEIPSGKDVQTIDISGSNVKSISLIGAPNLKTLDVTGTKIESLDISSCSKLEELRAENTPIKNLDISSNKELRQLLIGQNVALIGVEGTKLHEYWLPAKYSYDFVRKGIETLDVIATYNDKGLITHLTYSRTKGSDLSYLYDESSRIVAIIDEGAYKHRTDISYDSEGRVSSWKRSGDGGDRSMSYTYEDGGKTIRGTEISGLDQHNYVIKRDNDGKAISCTRTTAYTTGNGNSTELLMNYDASEQLVSCKQISTSNPEIDYAVTWDASKRISKITKTTLGGVTEGTNFTYDLNGRLEKVLPTSDFGEMATSFVYNEQGLPISWHVSSNSDFSTDVHISYVRYLTADEKYVPQKIFCFGGIYPNVNTYFWDPSSDFDYDGEAVKQLPAMVPKKVVQR